MTLAYAILATIVAALACTLLLFHGGGRGEDLAKIEQLELELAEYKFAAGYWQQECGDQSEIIGQMRRAGL